MPLVCHPCMASLHAGQAQQACSLLQRFQSKAASVSGFCLLLQIRVSDGTVADAYTIQDDFVHLNHSNAPHLYEDRLVTLGVSHLQHNFGMRLFKCMHTHLQTFCQKCPCIHHTAVFWGCMASCTTSFVGQQSYQSVLLMLLPSH